MQQPCLRSIEFFRPLQGLLTLDNGTTIEGTFSGSWTKRIEIVKGILEDSAQRLSEGSDYVDSALELQ